MWPKQDVSFRSELTQAQ